PARQHDEVDCLRVHITAWILFVTIGVLQCRCRNVKAGSWISIRLNQWPAVRLTITGDQSPPIPRMAGIAEVIETRSSIRVIRMIGAVSVYHQPRLVEECGVVVLECVNVRITDTF